jgi:hypothetical protein
MNNERDPLKESLAAWRDIEPRPGFEDAVWRRIERQPAPPRHAWWPVWATAAGIATGVLVGLAVTVPHRARANDFAMLAPSSVAGSYVHLVSGDTP